MALNKLGIGLIAGAIGIGAIGGLSGIIYASVQDTSIRSNSNTNNANKNDASLNNDSSANVTNQDLEEIANELNQLNVVVRSFKDQTNEINSNSRLQRIDTYAFNVNSKQLDIENNKVLKEKNVKYSFEINKDKNTIASLNNGLINATVKLVSNRNENINKTFDLALTGFKPASSELNNLITSIDNDFSKNNNYSLILKKASGKENEFKSIEELNKQNIKITLPKKEMDDRNEVDGEMDNQSKQITTNGLSLWLKDSTVGQTDMNKFLQLVGEVKLEKIQKGVNSDASNTYFKLVAKNENTVLKLVRKNTREEYEELALDSILTTNLAISSIHLKPQEFNENKTEKYFQALKEANNKEAKFSSNNNNTFNLNLENNNKTNNVVINPYLVNVQKQELDNELKTNLVINFGNKQYDTKLENDWNELKNVAFNFQIFSKVLEKTDEKIKVSEINAEANKLSTYFASNNYTMGLDKSAKSEQKEDSTKGEFYVTSFPANSNDGIVKVKIKESAKTQDDQTLKASQNLLLFANYTYSGINSSKVLYTPNLSLIRFELQTTNQA